MWFITVRSLFVATALLSLFVGMNSAAATDQLQLIWTREVARGIPSYVGSRGIATDGKSSLYLSSEGPYGAVWLERRSLAGDLLWRRTLGTPEYERVAGLVTDERGGVVLAGNTYGSYLGPNEGSSDVWFARYTKHGVPTLGKQFGTGYSDYPSDAAVDGDGNIYTMGTSVRVSGERYSWISKVAADGAVLWSRHDVPANNYAEDLAVDRQGNVYFLGSSYDAISGVSTPWLRKYRDTGHQLWEKRIGEADWGYARGIAIDDGDNLYILWNKFDEFSPFGEVRLSKYCTRC